MANHRLLRGVRWWRKLTKREWAVFSAALATVILTLSFVSHSHYHSGRYASLPANDGVPFTPLSNAHKKSACNFFFPKGFLLYAHIEFIFLFSASYLFFGDWWWVHGLLKLQFVWMEVCRVIISSRVLDLGLIIGFFTLRLVFVVLSCFPPFFLWSVKKEFWHCLFQVK